MATIFGGTNFFGKIGSATQQSYPTNQIFVKIALSSTVSEHLKWPPFLVGQIFLGKLGQLLSRDTSIFGFCIIDKNSKIQNGRHLWQMQYSLKLGKASLHRYPMDQNFCRNPTSKFLFYEENVFKKYSYISIILYVYLMSLYFQFCVLHFFVKNSKIEYDPHLPNLKGTRRTVTEF